MALLAPIPHPLALHSVDRGGAAIVAIVAHDTDNPKPGASSLNTLYTGDGRGVSIHALINRDGTYYRLVPDARGANHAGAQSAVLRLNGREWRAGAINRVTLGFELERSVGEPFYPDAQLRTMGALIADWRQTWGALPIVFHRDIDPTRRADPRDLSVAQIETWVPAAAPVLPPPAPTTPLDAPILSLPRCTLAQAQRLWAARGKRGEYEVSEVAAILSWYWETCAPVGVDPCLAVAQMDVETGGLTSALSQRSDRDGHPCRNPAGIGVNGETSPGPAPGFVWDSDRNQYRRCVGFAAWKRDSIPAHIGRLLAYALRDSAATPAQRELIAFAVAARPLPPKLRGAASTLRLLEGKWNGSPGTYAASIARIMDEMRRA